MAGGVILVSSSGLVRLWLRVNDAGEPCLMFHWFERLLLYEHNKTYFTNYLNTLIFWRHYLRSQRKNLSWMLYSTKLFRLVLRFWTHKNASPQTAVHRTRTHRMLRMFSWSVPDAPWSTRPHRCAAPHRGWFRKDLKQWVKHGEKSNSCAMMMIRLTPDCHTCLTKEWWLACDLSSVRSFTRAV